MWTDDTACQNCKRIERLEIGKNKKEHILNRVMSRKIGYEWIDIIWNVIESRRMEKEKKTEQKRIESGKKMKDHILNCVMPRKISYEWMDNIWEVLDSRRMER